MRIHFGKRVFYVGYSTPKILQRTIFFYIGLNFVLRGVQEQQDLVPSQFNRVPQDRSVYNTAVYYEYTELVSKNNQHRLKILMHKTRSFVLMLCQEIRNVLLRC